MRALAHGRLPVTSSASDDPVGTPSPEARPRVLVADDQPDIRAALELLLRDAGYRIQTAGSPGDVLAALEERSFDLLLMDLNYARDTTSGKEGLDLLARVRSRDPELPVLVMTAWGSIELAVEAMRRGARDFVMKPWDNALLTHAVAQQLRKPASDAGLSATTDLRVARRIQSRLLPQRLPALPSLECAARCFEAGAVGGDYYDFLEMGPGRLGLVLADASGKGVAGALLMAHLQASLRSRNALALDELPALLEGVNRLFYVSTAPEHYATLFFGCYDDRTRQLHYANCGHNPPLLLRRDGAIERLPATASVVGLLETWTCDVARVEMRAGDTLLVFSDGVVEASTGSEEFGEERLIRTAARLADRPLRSLPDTILAEVERFCGGPPADDITLVAARVRPLVPVARGE